VQITETLDILHENSSF